MHLPLMLSPGATVTRKSKTNDYNFDHKLPHFLFDLSYGQFGM